MTQTPSATAPRATVPATITYLLSREGQIASLSAGGNGRAKQIVEVALPTELLSYATITPEGEVSLDLSVIWPSPSSVRGRVVFHLQTRKTFDAPLADPVAEFQQAIAQAREESDRNHANNELKAVCWARTLLADPASTTSMPGGVRDWYNSLEYNRPELFASLPAVIGQAVAAREERLRRQEAEQREAEKVKQCERQAHIKEWIAEYAPHLHARYVAGVLPKSEFRAAVEDHYFGLLSLHPDWVWPMVPPPPRDNNVGTYSQATFEAIEALRAIVASRLPGARVSVVSITPDDEDDEATLAAHVKYHAYDLGVDYMERYYSLGTSSE